MLVLSCLQSSSIWWLTTLWMILLHSALSSTALKMSCNPIPVGVQAVKVKKGWALAIAPQVTKQLLQRQWCCSASCQFTCGLPLARSPSNVHWIICFSRLLFIRSVCPQKDSFLFLTACSKDRVTLTFSTIHSLVFFAVQDTWSMCLSHKPLKEAMAWAHSFPKAMILSSFPFFKVQLSQPC